MRNVKSYRVPDDKCINVMTELLLQAMWFEVMPLPGREYTCISVMAGSALAFEFLLNNADVEVVSPTGRR